jgi:4'-phosphopantetheinyl transferase
MSEIIIHRIALAQPHRSGCADAELANILAGYLGEPPVIVTDARGKPHVAGDRIAFNLSHSEAMAIVAVSSVGPLGVDLEYRGRARDTAALARRYFTPAEAALVAADPDVFYRIWTRKEAWVKAQGSGLAIPLDTVDVSGTVAGWLLEDIAIAPDYAAAVARPGGRASIRII